MFATRQTIKPAKDATVLNPETDKPLKKNGEGVIWSSYWERRWSDKSIELVKGSLKEKIDKKNKAIEEKKKKDAEAEKKKEVERKKAEAAARKNNLPNPGGQEG